MTYLRLLVFGAAALFGATLAQGESLPFAFTTDGRLAAGYSDRVPGSDLFLFSDANARLSFGDFGLDLGVFGLADALDTPHETYGTVTYDFAGGGRLAIGVPRPAYDSFAASAFETQFPLLGAARVGTTRSLATFGAMYAHFLPYGVRFQNETGNLRYAASVHSVPNQNTTIAGFGAAWPMGDWVLEGAVEVSWGKSTEVAGKLQAHGKVGRLSGGLGLYLPGTVGNPDAVEVFASYAPYDRVTVSGVLQVPLDGATDPSAGLSLRYGISSALSASAGVMTDAGANPAFSVFLDWTF